jgi:hypothetical protein
MIRIGSRERNKSKKQANKKANTLRSWKPRLEALEDRTVPSYTFTYNAATHVATAQGSGGAVDALIISQFSGVLGYSTDGGNIFGFVWSGVNVPAAANVTVDVNLSTGDGSSLQLGGGAAVNNNPASSLFAAFHVVASVQNTSDRMTIDDSAGSTLGTYTIDTQPGFITGPGINVDQSASFAFVGGVTLKGAPVNGQTYNVNSILQPAVSPAEPFTIITGSTGASNVNVGNAGSLSVGSLLAIYTAGGTATVNVNDAADTTHAAATLDNLSGNANAPFEVTGLSHSPIEYGSGVTAVNVNGGTNGAGGVTYNVNNTQAGTTLTINGGANNDTFNLAGSGFASGSTNNFHGNNGNDTFNVTPVTLGATVNIDGGPPATFPGDTLTYFGAGSINPTGAGSGTITQTGFATVNFTNIELATTNLFSVISTPNGLVITATGDRDYPNEDDQFVIFTDPTGQFLAISQNGATGIYVPLTAVYQININGLGGNDNLTVDSSHTLINIPNGIRYDGGTGFNRLTLQQNALQQNDVLVNFALMATSGSQFGVTAPATINGSFHVSAAFLAQANGTYSGSAISGFQMQIGTQLYDQTTAFDPNIQGILLQNHAIVGVAMNWSQTPQGLLGPYTQWATDGTWEAGSTVNQPFTAILRGGPGSQHFSAVGTTQTSDTYSVGPNPGEGTDVIVGPSGTQTVYFQSLAPVTDNVPATTATVNGTNADNAINYSQGPGGGIFTGNTGLVTVDNQESYEFNNKTNLVINGLAGSDVFNLNNPTVPAGLTGTITTNGGDPTASDTLIVNGRVNAADAFTYTPATTTSDTGSVADTGLPTVNFSGLEHLTINGQNGGPGGVGDSLTINTSNLSSGQNEILTPGTTFDSGHVDFRDRPGGVNPTAVPLDFAALGVAGSLSFTDSGVFDNLIYNGTNLNDTFTVNAAGQVILNTQIPVNTSPDMRTLTLAGLDGNDTYNIAGNNNLPGFNGSPGVIVQGGNPASDVLNFTGNGAGAVTVDPAGQTVTETGFAAVSYSSVSLINVNAGGAAMAVNGTAGDDTFNFVPTAVGVGSFTTSSTGATPLTSPQFTYTNVGGNITVNGGTGVDTLGLAGTAGDDNINVVQSSATALAYTLNAFTQNFTVNAMEASRIDAGDGNDVVQVSVADALVGSLHYIVHGGSGVNRLLVNDQGPGDLTVLREIDGQSGNATVGALQPITYDGMQRIDVTPVNNLTGGTGADGNGRVVVFHSDPFEYNDTRLSASQLSRVPAFPTSPTIDSAAITLPAAAGGDEDWYQFLPQQTGTYNISIIFRTIGTLANGRAGLPGSGNLTLDIFDATGTLITSGVATVDLSGVTHLSATFGATNDLTSVFSDIYVRVRGATPDSVNVYDFDHLPTAAILQGDNEGPQVTNVQITGFPDYNLFGLKPVDALQGPTPLINSLTISFQDLPARAPGFVYPALDFQTASTPGQYVLRGDRVGIIAISNIIVTNNPVVVGGVATATVELDFAQPLPDDHYTLTVSDHIRDPAGNKLDGESNAQEPNEGPTFPSGDGHPGGNFIAAFVVDSRPELGFYANGAANIDINGDFIVNPNVLPEGDVILPYGPNGAAVFSGQFSDPSALAVNGFDRLGTYGKENGLYGFRLDFNDDGDFNDPGEFIPTIWQINGLPIAGHFSDAKAGDEVGVFTGTTWYLNTSGTNVLGSPGDTVLHGNMRGLPITGDFDGDGHTDLGTYQNGTFYFDLSANDPGGQLTGNTNASFRVTGLPGGVNGVASRLARPVAGDFNRDGITDVGLFMPNSLNLTRYQANWYFLVSNENLYGPRIAGTVNNLNHPFHSNQLPGGSNDFSATYGSSRALPIVGNFDPPAAVIAARQHGATTSAARLASLILAHDLTDLYFATDIDPHTGLLRRHHA